MARSNYQGTVKSKKDWITRSEGSLIDRDKRSETIWETTVMC